MCMTCADIPTIVKRRQSSLVQLALFDFINFLSTQKFQEHDWVIREYSPVFAICIARAEQSSLELQVPPLCLGKRFVAEFNILIHQSWVEYGIRNWNASEPDFSNSYRVMLTNRFDLSIHSHLLQDLSPNACPHLGLGGWSIFTRSILSHNLELVPNLNRA